MHHKNALFFALADGELRGLLRCGSLRGQAFLGRHLRSDQKLRAHYRRQSRAKEDDAKTGHPKSRHRQSRKARSA